MPPRDQLNLTDPDGPHQTPEDAGRDLASRMHKSGKFDPDSFRMPLGDHIEELRSCIVRGLLGVVVALVVAFIFGFDIIAWLAQPLLQVMDMRGYPPQLYVQDATAGFGTFLRVVIVSALVFASPWIVYQIWRFVATGLYENERKVVYVLAPFSTLMTVLAVSFTYFFMIPAGMWFFYGFVNKFPAIEYDRPNPFVEMLAGDGADGEEGPVYADGPALLPILEGDPAELSDGMAWIDARGGKLKYVANGRVYAATVAPTSMVTPIPVMSEYIKFVTMVGLGIVVAFQTPVVMLVFGWVGVVDPKWLSGVRKYALMGCFVASAVVTPADPITMMLLGGPLYGLFEFGLLLMRLVYREPEAWDPDDPLGLKEAEGADGGASDGAAEATPPEGPAPRGERWSEGEAGEDDPYGYGSDPMTSGPDPDDGPDEPPYDPNMDPDADRREDYLD